MSDEYVKRKDVLAMFSQSRTISQAMDGFMRLPSADVVERKRGEWIIEKCDDAWGIESYMITCSECGDRFKVTEKALPYEHFCRYCGADMRERKDNE